MSVFHELWWSNTITMKENRDKKTSIWTIFGGSHDHNCVHFLIKSTLTKNVNFFHHANSGTQFNEPLCCLLQCREHGFHITLNTSTLQNNFNNDQQSYCNTFMCNLMRSRNAVCRSCCNTQRSCSIGHESRLMGVQFRQKIAVKEPQLATLKIRNNQYT